MGVVEEAVKGQCGLTPGWPAKPLMVIVSGASLIGLLWSLFEKEVLPPGSLFSLLLLLSLAYPAALLATWVRLPPLLGMLLTGIILRSLHVFHVHGVYRDVVVICRDVSLGVILIKAGLGLDGRALLKFSFTVLRLAFCPCVVEALVAAFVSHLYAGLPWVWALLLGFLLSAVSPAVVVPSLLALKDKGYGEDKGIATLVVAASSLDDILSISFFGVFLAMISPEGSVTNKILMGPLELVIGLLAGILWGFVAALLPHREYVHVEPMRIWIVGSGGLTAVLGSKKIGFPGAGPLAAIAGSFVAGLSWTIQGWPNSNAVTKFFSNMWLVMQPALFGLIGTEIDVTKMQLSEVGTALVILGCCLTVRVIVCFFVLFGCELNTKEKFFVSLAWLPKATVQAALSTVALELVKEEDKDDLARAKMILTTAVLAILITAPIGSIAISLTAPYLLSKPLSTNAENEA